MQLYPSPWKPERQAHTGSPSSSLQNPFGPQDGEQPDMTAENTNILQIGSSYRMDPKQGFENICISTCALSAIAFISLLTSTDIRSNGVGTQGVGVTLVLFRISALVNILIVWTSKKTNVSFR